MQLANSLQGTALVVDEGWVITMTNKPMYCPMSFGKILPETTRIDGEVEKEPYYFKCTPDCAWAVINRRHDLYMCAAALKFAEHNDYGVNCRPLKEDAE